MTPCPADSQLQSILSGELPHEDHATWDIHLGECDHCRSRLENMADVASISRVVKGNNSARSLSDSMCLKMVMERLQQESAEFATCLSTPSEQAGLVATIPVLQPTMMPGYMGRLGTIQIRRIIGRGGMGVVFEGLDTVLNRTVAVKVLSPHLLQHPDAKSRFLREAQAAAALHHENVVAIHSIDEADGMPYLVLQYVQGESLAERLHRVKKLNFAELLPLAKQLARGLAAAHDRHLIHRDIKPANILIDSASHHAYLSDFGLAKYIGHDSVTAIGTLAGTPAYMSPEQANDHAVDARSDLFSLGVVLYQAASGVLPFHADSPFVILNQIRTAKEKLLVETDAQVPTWFAQIVHRLLRKEPENRISSAAELITLLEKQCPELATNSTTNNSTRWPVIIASILVTLGLITVSTWTLLTGKVAPNSTSSVISNKPQQQGFVVQGRNELYSTLAEAVREAGNQSVIEVQGDGPFFTEPLTIESKNLTIKAASGSHPRFVPDVDHTAYAPFLHSHADLHLEGLEIFWPKTPSVTKLEDPGSRSAVYASGSRLTMLNCRVIGGTNMACVAAATRETLIRRCHFVSPSGVCIGWQTTTHPIIIEDCVLEGRAALNVTRPSSASTNVRPGVQFHNNLVVTQRTFQVLLENLPKNTISITACRNIIDCPAMIILVPLPKNPFNLTKPETMESMMRTCIAWSEEANIYRKRLMFLGSLRLNQPLINLPSDLKLLEQWLAAWKMEKSQSIEGTIRYHDRPANDVVTPLQVLRIDAPSGALPVNAGPSAPVGPGQAYLLSKKAGK